MKINRLLITSVLALSFAATYSVYACQSGETSTNGSRDEGHWSLFTWVFHGDTTHHDEEKNRGKECDNGNGNDNSGCSTKGGHSTSGGGSTSGSGSGGGSTTAGGGKGIS